MLPRLRVLAIDRGLGGRLLDLLRASQACLLLVAAVPEPSDDLDEGVRVCQALVRDEKPDIIVAGSRGGKVVAKLVATGCNGPFLLLSAMSTAEIVRPRVFITLVHGRRDGTNPIERVREDVSLGSQGAIKLIELDDEHGLHSLMASQLDEALRDLYDRSRMPLLPEPSAPAAPKAASQAALRVGLLGQLKARSQAHV